LQHVEHKYIQQYTFYFIHRSELYAHKCSGTLVSPARAYGWISPLSMAVGDAECAGVNIIFYALQSFQPPTRAL